ncbi:WD40 repeat domain-containing protein [Vairimorpha necatrix]|uniref:WD40 repeat domain-containing protein n=1 Tax=Vairimorpha necatrix TaxID=6039 RepID=A0AAX4J8P7_9MICR
MDKKVDEMANSVKNETVNDLLNFLNSNYKQTPKEKSAWDYVVKMDNISQPPLIPSVSNPIILYKDNETFFSFDGRTLFFDKNYSDFYVFMPFAIKNACIVNFKEGEANKKKSVIVTLDTQNKLTYSCIKGHTINDRSVIISRNVLQMIEKNNEIYYLSFKKDNYFVNIVTEDNGFLKPRIVVQNLTSKYGMSIFLTSDNIYLYQDRFIISTTGKKLKIKGDGIYEISNMSIIYSKTKTGLRFSLCDNNFVIKTELSIESSSFIVKIITLDNILCCRIGSKINFIIVDDKELVIVKEIDLPDNILDFSVKLAEDKNISVSCLLQTNGNLNDVEENNSTNLKESALEKTQIKRGISDTFDASPECTSNMNEETSLDSEKDVQDVFVMPTPSLNSKLYNPSESNLSYNSEYEIPSVKQNFDLNIQDQASNSSDPNSSLKFVNLFTNTESKNSTCRPDCNNFQINDLGLEKYLSTLINNFEKKIEERDEFMNIRNLKLLEKFTEKSVNFIKDMIKSELSNFENKLNNSINQKLNNFSRKEINEEKILEFTKDLICENLLPVVEASMDEMRVQVLSVVSEFKEPEYFQEVRSALSNLSIFESISEIERNVRSGNIDKSVECVLKGTFFDIEELNRVISPKQLELVSSRNLMGFLEKCVLMANENYKTFIDDLVYNSLTFIEPENLTDDELRTLIIILTQIKDSEIFVSENSKQILVLVDFLNFKIPKILFKRQKSLKN